MSFNPAQLISSVLQSPAQPAQSAHSGPLDLVADTLSGAWDNLHGTGMEAWEQYQRGRSFDKAFDDLANGDIDGAILNAFQGINHHMNAAKYDTQSQQGAARVGQGVQQIVNGTPPGIQGFIDQHLGGSGQAGQQVSNALNWANNQLTV